MSLNNWFDASNRLSPQYKAIQKKIAIDPYYRFQSLIEVEIAARLGVRIDVNQATIDDWLRLPMVSIHQARSIVELVGAGVRLLCIEDVAAVLNLPPQKIQPFATILHFEYYDSDSLLAPQKINANGASLEQLEAIPVLSGTVALKIYQNRQELGNYRNLADLQSRLQLDKETIVQLAYYLSFNK
jgi:DNA uptake protein ComE-like DNA-binding protein